MKLFGYLLLLNACAGCVFSAESLQIVNSNQHLVRSCDGRSVQISGSDNWVRLTGHCHSVQVSGANNHVRIEETDALQTTGTGNVVTWLRGHPTTQNTGPGNVISRASKGSGEDDTESTAGATSSQSTVAVGGSSVDSIVDAATKAAEAGSTAAASVAGSVTSQQTDAHTINLILSGQKITRDCGDGKGVNINGYQNQITLTGSCGPVALNGWGNRLYLEEVGEISVSGHSNTVTWERSREGSRPKVSVLNGYDNRVHQQN